jgi:glycogen debranching enzyme
VSQEVSIENVIEMVNYTTLNQAKQEELREIIRDFEDELSAEEPDTSKLRDFIESAKGYSVDVSAKLAMLALSHGIVDVLKF